MDLDIRARNVRLDNHLRESIDRHLGKIGKKVSPLATMHVEIRAERNPAIENDQVADVRLHLKGKVLRAHAASTDSAHAVELVAEKLSRQVERYFGKRRPRSYALHRAA